MVPDNSNFVGYLDRHHVCAAAHYHGAVFRRRTLEKAKWFFPDIGGAVRHQAADMLVFMNHPQSDGHAIFA